MFVFPEEQRVLTPEEYAALGYVQLHDTPQELSVVPDKPLSKGLNLPVYRAETKEEYAIDLAVGIVKAGYAYSTGGLGMAGKTSVGYVWSLLT